MKIKTLRILVIVLGALLALALVKKIFVHGPAMTVDKADKASEVLVSPRILEEFVTRLVFYLGDEPDNKVVVVKSPDGEWVIETLYNARARQNFISGLIKDLSELRGQWRSDSPAVLADFKIRDEEGLHIILEGAGGQEIYHAVIGRKAIKWNVNYIRQAGTSKVASVPRAFLDIMGIKKETDRLKSATFAEMRLWPMESLSKVQKVWIMTAAPAPVTLVKLAEDNKAKLPAGWYVDPPSARSAADERKVTKFLRGLMTVHPQDRMDPKGTGYGLDTLVLSAAVETKEEDNTTRAYRMDLSFVTAPEKAIYAQTFPGQEIYRIREQSIADLNKDIVEIAQNKKFFLKTSGKK
jgi:hypothetical protein